MAERPHKTPPRPVAHDATLPVGRLGQSGGVLEARPAKALSSRDTEPASIEIDPLVGSQLRHFRIEKLLGRGAMGSVYLGHDTSLDRPVALKVLSPQLTHDPEVVQRFAREARTQARVRHMHVTQIYFIGEDRGLHFFAMEYIEGGTLDLEEKLSWQKGIEYILMAARGLRAAHQQGFIHRDVKPSNLLIDLDGTIKIADFGLVKSVSGDGELTQKGMIVGSPMYMAPEQGRAEQVDHRADIYSLGCTFYHLLTGRPPFDSPSPVAIMSMHVTDRATRVRAAAPDVPEGIERVIDRMMSKDPVARFASYDDLIAALEALRPGQREFSGFFTRAGALGIDVALLGTITVFARLWALPLWPAYFIVLHGLFGQTLGKRLLRLRLTTTDGRRPSWKVVALRFGVFAWAPMLWSIAATVIYFIHRHRQISFSLDQLDTRQLVEPLIYILASALLLVAWLSGFLMAAFHPRRQALHDVLLRTEVSYMPSGGLRSEN